MKAFFDTNILVYASTEEDEFKKIVARRLIEGPHPSAHSISTQVLAEAYNVLTTRKRWIRSEALAAVRVFSRMNVVVLGCEGVLAALELAAAHTLSTWDAMIVQAALESGCDTLFSEDLQSGRRFGALEVINPFTLQAQEPTALRAPRPKVAAKARGVRSRR